MTSNRFGNFIFNPNRTEENYSMFVPAPQQRQPTQESTAFAASSQQPATQQELEIGTPANNGTITDTTLAPITTSNHSPPDASQQEQKKRARVDASVTNPKVTPGQSPVQTAGEFIENSVELGIKLFLLTRGKEYISLGHNLFLKRKRLKHVEKDDDYVISSTRVKFTLTAVKEVEELQEFTELQEKAKNIITARQNELKACILESLKLEISTLQKRLNQHLCRSLHHTAELYLLANKKSPENAHATVLALLAQHHKSLLKYSNISSKDFLALYQSTVATDSSNPTTCPPHITAAMYSAFKPVFVTSWDYYLHQSSENEIELSLKKQAKATILETKTEAAVMDVDSELPADHKQLQELIDQKVEQRVTAALRAAGVSKKTVEGPSSARRLEKKEIRQAKGRLGTNKPTHEINKKLSIVGNNNHQNVALHQIAANNKIKKAKKPTLPTTLCNPAMENEIKSVRTRPTTHPTKGRIDVKFCLRSHLTRLWICSSC